MLFRKTVVWFIAGFVIPLKCLSQGCAGLLLKLLTRRQKLCGPVGLLQCALSQKPASSGNGVFHFHYFGGVIYKCLTVLIVGSEGVLSFPFYFKNIS